MLLLWRSWFLGGIGVAGLPLPGHCCCTTYSCPPRGAPFFFLCVSIYPHISRCFFFVLWRQLNEPENPPPPLCLYILPLTRRVWPVCFCLCLEGPGGRDCFVNTLWKTDTDRGHKNGPDRASA